MKAFKSVVLLTAGVLALSACDKRNDNQTSAVSGQDTTMGAGATGNDLNAGRDLPEASDVNTNTETTQGTGIGAGAVSSGDTHDNDAGAGVATGAATGAAAGAATSDDFDSTTSEGSGAVSDEAASDELNADEEFSEDTEIQEEESYRESSTLGTGAGTSSGNSEYIDESSSEPDDVRGGRSPRLVPKNLEIDNTSSEPDQQDL